MIFEVDGVFEIHASRKSDFRRGKRLGKRDHIVEWNKPQRPEWMSEELYNKLPKSIKVREMKVGGKILVTTILAKKEALKNELGKLYKMRWNVEVDLKYIKQILKMDVLRCKTPEMVRKEIAIHLLTYNLIRMVIVQSASIHEKLPIKLAFKSAIQTVNSYWDNILFVANNRVLSVLKIILSNIAYQEIGNRPGRSEPRAVKRRPKAYPRLAVSREEARKMPCFARN